MSRGLYRVSITPDYKWDDAISPVYVVSDNKKAAAAYVEEYLRKGTVGKVAFLADQLGVNMYHKAKG